MNMLKRVKNLEIRDDIDTKELSQFIQANINEILFMFIIQENINLKEVIDSNIKHTGIILKNKNKKVSNF